MKYITVFGIFSYILQISNEDSEKHSHLPGSTVEYLCRLEKFVQINECYLECKIGTGVWEQEFLTKLGI
jgi:hypothetical protein